MNIPIFFLGLLVDIYLRSFQPLDIEDPAAMNINGIRFCTTMSSCFSCVYVLVWNSWVRWQLCDELFENMPDCFPRQQVLFYIPFNNTQRLQPLYILANIDYFLCLKTYFGSGEIDH